MVTPVLTRLARRWLTYDLSPDLSETIRRWLVKPLALLVIAADRA